MQSVLVKSIIFQKDWRYALDLAGSEVMFHTNKELGRNAFASVLTLKI